MPDAAASEAIARSLPDTGGVYLVPAFTGLGAPWWDPDARGAILGLNRDSGLAQIVRAALEASAYQTGDLLGAMTDDAAVAGAGTGAEVLRVDGGMVANDWFCQFLADILARPVERPAVIETTAWGAACLAGLGCGLFASMADVERAWRVDRAFVPAMETAMRQRLLAGWQDAVRRVRSGG